MDKVKIVVVGVGGWGRQHCLSIKKIPAAELVGVVGRNRGKASARGVEMGVMSFTSITDAIEATGADAVTVVLAHNAHLPAALEAMKQGVHLYVEKSFGSSLADAVKMTETAQKSHVKLMAGFSQRYEPSYLELARLAKSGSLGKLRYIFAKRQSTGGFGQGWIADPLKAGGGALAGWGTHDVDLVMNIADSEPRIVYAQMELDEKGRDIQSHILVRHASGAISGISIEYFAFGSDAFAWVLGDAGRADAQRGGELIVRRAGSQPATKRFPEREYPAFLTDALSAFVNCIVEDEPPPIPAEDGVRDWKVVDAAYRSARSGESIRL